MDSKLETDSYDPEASTSVPPGAIRAELARILASPAFKATPQRRRILEFIVNETLAGRSSQIKGFTIGTAVMDRGADFDPNSDPIVRLEARRLRHDLDSYYVAEGRDNTLRISVPTGRYVPEFTLQDVQTAPGVTSTEPGPAVTPPSAQSRRFRSAWIAGIATAVAAVALTAWAILQPGDNTAPGPQIPSIAVLPFNVLSARPQDEFLAASLTSRIVSDLSRFPDIDLYSPILSFSQRPDADPVEIGTLMGLAYVVAGDLRSDTDSLTVSTRLIDTASGRIIWTETHDRALSQNTLAAIESDIAAGIASSIGQPFGALRSDLTRELDPSGASVSNYECVLQGYHFRRTYSPALQAQLVDCLNEAVRTDPDYAEAWAMLGFTRAVTAALSILPDFPDANFEKGSEAALQAIALDPDNTTGLKVLSMINHYQENFDDSERYIRRALDINPNDPDTLYQMGWRLAIRGRFDEGIPLLEQAIENTINPPGPYFHLLAIDRLMKKDGAEMLDYAQRAAVDGSALSQSLIAMAHGLLGDAEAQAEALARMNEISPGYDPISGFRNHKATDEIAAAMNHALQLTGKTE